MAFTDGRGKVHFVQGTATTAEVNAGKIIALGRENKKICVVGGQMTSTGNAAGATSVDIKDTGTPTVAVACAVAGLTNGTQLDFDAAANVTRTTYRKPLGEDKSLQIVNTGSDLSTATAIDYYVEYVYIDAT